MSLIHGTIDPWAVVCIMCRIQVGALTIRSRLMRMKQKVDESADSGVKATHRVPIRQQFLTQESNVIWKRIRFRGNLTRLQPWSILNIPTRWICDSIKTPNAKHQSEYTVGNPY